MNNPDPKQNSSVPPNREACGECPSDEVLTAQESAVLSEMRAVKDELQPIADRLAKLEDQIKHPKIDITSERRNTEWAKLEGKMSELREEWRKWQERLDEAIEQKMRCLGHRE